MEWSFSIEYWDFLSVLNLLVNNCWPSNYPLSTAHSIEVTSATMSISSHTIEAKPITYLSINWYIDTLGNYIHTITRHPKKSWISALKDCARFIFFIHFWVKLVISILKANTIHKCTVKTVINRLINMITGLTTFNSFTQNSC